MFRRIFAALYRPGEVFGLAEVVRFLNANPELVELNRHTEAQYWRRTAEKARLEYVDGEGVRRLIQA